MGPVGSGQLTKLINNYFTAAHMETAAHELRLIRALGVVNRTGLSGGFIS
jgi:3-hydroxyisobutyrate dehydrogenase-like beta-hydroxyacid dehydrogenase